MFAVKEVVPIRGMYADPELAPVIPGLSDAGSCSEWETGVPVDLEAIRDKADLRNFIQYFQQAHRDAYRESTTCKGDL